MNALLRESYHELYTPLSLIKSSLSLQELENGQNEHTQNIKAAVQSLHSICEDIYYGITEKERKYPKEWIDLEEFLSKRMQLFEAQMSIKSITYNFISQIESPMIHINSTELERLLDNLISNAIKYALKESCIHIAIRQVNEKIELSITNASQKIKNVKELFKELYREDYSVTGIGMGLNIVKRICTKNSITIDVQNDDKSTKFILQYKENR
jgi:signal transduction histidine kinase